MLVEYATSDIDAPDLEAFEQWQAPLVAACREEVGCLAYEVRVDPGDRTRRALFQAWESAEAFAAHIDFPAHKEMLVGGKPWRSSNVVIRRWDDARGYQHVMLDGAEKRAGVPVRREGRPATGRAVAPDANATGVGGPAMVVQYATMEIDAPHVDAYERWHSPIVAACRQEAGCLTYEATIDPSDPTRRALFQAWESVDAFLAHRAFAHNELQIERTPWESRNVVIFRWEDARAYHEVTLEEARARVGLEAEE